MNQTSKYNSAVGKNVRSLGSVIPAQLEEETAHAICRLKEALGGEVDNYVASRLQLSPDQLSVALAAEQVDGVALAMYNIEARGQSVIIGDQTGIGKGRQAAAMIRYGMLAGYLPIFITDRYTLFSDMYRDCKALGIAESRPLVLNQKVTVVDFDNPIETIPKNPTDEIWSPEDDPDGQTAAGLYAQQYEEVYRSPKKTELESMYQSGDIPADRYEYVMLTYSQLKNAKKDMTRLDFLTSLCEKHRVLFVFDEAHKSSSVTAGKISTITQCINSILEECPQTQCVFLSATFAKRPECLITFMRQTVLSSLATSETLQKAFANGGVPMQEYVSSKLAYEGQMIRREHCNNDLPEPIYTYLDEQLPMHSELFDKVMYWFRELVKLSDMIKDFMVAVQEMEILPFKPYPTRAQLFYVNKILLLSLKAKDVAQAAVKEVQSGRSVVIGMSDTLECVLRNSLESTSDNAVRGDFSAVLLRLLDKTVRDPKNPNFTVYDLVGDDPRYVDLRAKAEVIKTYADQIKADIESDVFHLPMSPIDVIRQLITQESFSDPKGIKRKIRFEECTMRARQLEYLSPEGNDEFVNATLVPRKKRHSNLIYNDFQNNKLEVILVNACGAIGASAHAIPTGEVPENEVRQRKMLIVQNDLDVNTDLQKRGRINRTGQLDHLPPLYEYIITAIPSEKRLNMMLRAKLRSLSANTTANQDQDKCQADFVDIANKYGNLVTQEFLANNQDLAFVLGVKKSATASQLLARLAMLSVAAQEVIIDELIDAYQTKEQELRRINQWDLERENRDFEAEFVHEELFTAPVDTTALGGSSMLATFLCRHKTFPYDSSALQKEVQEASAVYGSKLGESDLLKKEIRSYYTAEYKKIRAKIKERKEKLFATTLSVLEKYGLSPETAQQMLLMAQRLPELWSGTIDRQLQDIEKAKSIRRKLKSYNKEFEDLGNREKEELKLKSEQRAHLMVALNKAVIGQGYWNILPQMPLEESFPHIIAVLKEVRLGKNPAQHFLPGKVQFVFALSAGHKELVLNLVDKGRRSNYERLIGILQSHTWNFRADVWDEEIAKYNNRILERKIITGNILGAFANPLIERVKPHFISFTLAPDENGVKRLERGLLLPLSGENIEKLMSEVTLSIGDGLQFANAVNHVYRISGIGMDFSLIPTRTQGEDTLKFILQVNEKDSHAFEGDSRFDPVRDFFKPSVVTSIYNGDTPSKRPLKSYGTEALTTQSLEFWEIMNLLVSLRAVILIPRKYITVAQMKEFAGDRKVEDNSNWPNLDWKGSVIMPPIKSQFVTRISAPVDPGSNVVYVDELSPLMLLCTGTLETQGKSLQDQALIQELRSLYFEWQKVPAQGIDSENLGYAIPSMISNTILRLVSNAAKFQTVTFDDFIIRKLRGVANKYQLSAYGKILTRFRKDMFFQAPSKEKAQQFLDECLYDPRLDTIRKRLEDYIAGKTDIIL